LGKSIERTQIARGHASSPAASHVVAARYAAKVNSVHITEHGRVADLLGARRAFDETSDTSKALIALIRRGLPLSAVRSWPAKLGLTRSEVERVLGLGARALDRRTGSRLTSGESERAVRVARLVAQAERAFRDPARALAWCQRPQPSLGHETPFQVLDTGMGGSAVRELLERVERDLQHKPSA